MFWMMLVFFVNFKKKNNLKKCYEQNGNGMLMSLQVTRIKISPPLICLEVFDIYKRYF